MMRLKCKILVLNPSPFPKSGEKVLVKEPPAIGTPDQSSSAASTASASPSSR